MYLFKEMGERRLLGKGIRQTVAVHGRVFARLQGWKLSFCSQKIDDVFADDDKIVWPCKYMFLHLNQKIVS